MLLVVLNRNDRCSGHHLTATVIALLHVIIVVTTVNRRQSCAAAADFNQDLIATNVVSSSSIPSNVTEWQYTTMARTSLQWTFNVTTTSATILLSLTPAQAVRLPKI